MKATINLRNRQPDPPEPVRHACGAVGEPVDRGSSNYPRVIRLRNRWFRCPRCRITFPEPRPPIRRPIGIGAIGHSEPAVAEPSTATPDTGD